MMDFIDKNIKLDLIDRKILTELSLNARIPLSNIAKKIKHSKQVVKYRIDNLEKNDIIKGYYVVLNLSRLGFLYHRAFLKYRKILDKEEEDILNHFKKHPNIGWVSPINGHWDLALSFLLKDIFEFEKILNDLGERYGDYFKARYVSIVTNIHHLNYKFFVDDVKKEDFVFDNKLGSLILDDTDIKLIEILHKNARMPTTKIADILGCSANVIKYRIKKLVDDGVILCFDYKLNYKLLGYTQYKINVTLSNTAPKRVRQLINYLKAEKTVIYITEVVGTFDLEFETYSKNYDVLHQLMRQIMINFSDILRDFDVLVMCSEDFNYIPRLKTD